ncbi:MAG: class B sortase [Lachnospiraceae bacterium]|nr:class B sortase [Lachnospiraceae bacterium]
MTSENLSVGGVRFRTRADYEAALRDQKKIDEIRAHVDFNNKKQLEGLFNEMQAGGYRFETIIGTHFDDEVYEKMEQMKKNLPVQKKERKRLLKKNGKNTLQKGVKATALAGRQTSGSKVKNPENNAKYQAVIEKEALKELQKAEKLRKKIVVLASIVAVASLGYFFVYYYFSARTNMDYDQLASLKGSEALSSGTQQEQNTFSLHKSSVRLPDILPEYETLYNKNKKLIGWLKIDDTNIDYPVMQTSDNTYYLDHNYNQEYDKNGSIFLDYNCSVYPRSTNMIVYGHHMKSGNMFGNLQKYAKESYGKKHSVITFDTIYEKAQYQVMYVFRSQVYNEDDIVFKYYQFIEANSETEFNSYMQEMSALSLYDTGVTAEFGDNLLTLSTCDSSQTDGRFVVVAKRIS